jgi:hypothetical protein
VEGHPIFSSILSARLVATLLVVGCLAACGGSGGSGGSGGGSTTKVVHLGCHQFCQQAGGFGGGPGGRPTVRFDTKGEVAPSGDGTVTLTQTCLLPVRCAGALLLDPANDSLAAVCKPFFGQVNWWGQSDLDIPARATQSLAVPLSPCARAQVAKRGRVRMFITADVGLVPACAKIPALVAACHRFATNPGYTPAEGDGLNRLVSGDFTLVSKKTGS